MAKLNLLVVDDDPQTLRVLEVSLRNAGFTVTTASNGAEALTKVESVRPSLILTDTTMPVLDGYELCRRVKRDPELAEVPFIFLTDATSVEDRIKGLELGADDYLTRPVYIKEVISRVRIALQRREREALNRRGRRRFFGSLDDMGVVDLLQTIDLGKKSGSLRLDHRGQQGLIFFADGRVIDAEAGKRQGEDALFRILTWDDGTFEADFQKVERRTTIQGSVQSVLMEGLRRVDEWGRMCEQLPPLGTVFQVDYTELADRLSELPDEVNSLLRLFDGRRAALEVIDESELADLDALAALSRLYFEGIIFEAAPQRTFADAPRADEPVARNRFEDWIGQDEPEPVREPVRANKSSSAFPGRDAPALGPERNLVDDLLASASELPSVDLGGFGQDPLGDDLGLGLGSDPFSLGGGGSHQDPFDFDPLGDPAAEFAAISGEGALPSAPPPAKPEPPPPAAGAAPTESSEAHFFENPPELSEEPEAGGSSMAPYLALGLVLLAAGAAALFFFLRDTVEPKEAGSALAQDWHEKRIEQRPAPQGLSPLDAAWQVPYPPDGGVADAEPEPESPRDAAPPARGPDEAPPSEPAPTTGPKTKGEFESLMKEGRALLQASQFREAAATFEKAVGLAPEDEAALLELATAQLENERDAEALKAAQRALKQNPGSARAHLIVGFVRQNQGNKEAAVDAYERYLQLAPTGQQAEEIRRVLSRMR